MYSFKDVLDTEYKLLKNNVNVDDLNLINLCDKYFNTEKFKSFYNLFINERGLNLNLIFENFMLLNLTIDEKNILNNVNLAYNKDIELLFENREYIASILNSICNNVSDIDRNYIKTLYALKVYFYIKDKRTVFQLVDSLLRGWAFENAIINTIKNLPNLSVILNGNDKDRKLNLFSFSTIPDLIVNGLYLELQNGNNTFFKLNKLNSNINKNSNILFYYANIDKFYIFTPNELKDILNSEEVIAYTKKGRKFDVCQYKFSTLEEQILKIYPEINDDLIF